MLTQKVIHSVSVTITRDKAQVLGYIQDGNKLTEWLVGAPDIMQVSPGEYETSRAEIRHIFVVCEPSSELEGQDRIYFDVGAERTNVDRRILAILSPVRASETQALACHLELIAGRTSGMSDARWQDVCERHEAEINNLKVILDR